MSVNEPTICHYELRFETPLACPIDAFLGKIFLEMSATCCYNLQCKIVVVFKPAMFDDNQLYSNASESKYKYNDD